MQLQNTSWELVRFLDNSLKIVAHNTLAKKSVEEGYQKRLELEKPVHDELFAWVEKLYVTPKSKLGEAADYPA